MSQNNGITRRNLIKLGGISAGVLGLGALAGCGGTPSSSTTSTTGSGSSGAALTVSKANGGMVPAFVGSPNKVTVAETKEYDIVVVGAGAAGVPAAMAAVEAGASVAVLQKQDAVSTQGGNVGDIDKANSDPVGIAACVNAFIADQAYRPMRALFQAYVDNSKEAATWFADICNKNGNAATSSPVNKKFAGATVVYDGTGFATGGMQGACETVAAAAAAAGAEFFYSTPADQLVLDANKVVGVIAKGSDGSYAQFNAKKGVILAAGDYQNNEDFTNLFLPDMVNNPRGQMGKTGDGQLMGMWAGGVMEPLPHTKYMHLERGTVMLTEPFLAVNGAGKRFCAETINPDYMPELVRYGEGAGVYYQIFDADYNAAVTGWGGTPAASADIDAAVKGGTAFQEQTIDALAKDFQIDATALKASVDQYNKLAAAGKDIDFGKDAKYLKPIATAPFTMVKRVQTLNICLGGLAVNEDSQVVNADNDPIEGLYAVGNCSGGYFGGVDYIGGVSGMTLGRAVTFGYSVGKKLAK